MSILRQRTRDGPLGSSRPSREPRVGEAAISEIQCFSSVTMRKYTGSKTRVLPSTGARPDPLSGPDGRTRSSSALLLTVAGPVQPVGELTKFASHDLHQWIDRGVVRPARQEFAWTHPEGVGNTQKGQEPRFALTSFVHRHGHDVQVAKPFRQLVLSQSEGQAARFHARADCRESLSAVVIHGLIVRFRQLRTNIFIGYVVLSIWMILHP